MIFMNGPDRAGDDVRGLGEALESVTNLLDPEDVNSYLVYLVYETRWCVKNS